jgi:hypothetical protein
MNILEICTNQTKIRVHVYRDFFLYINNHILRNYWVYGIRKLIVAIIREVDEVRPVTVVALATGITHVAYANKQQYINMKQ